MRHQDPPLDPAEITAATSSLRELARRLVRDGAVAEDVAQDAWLVALAGDCPADVPLRWWLAGVARHLAFRFLRGETRRRGRERAVARPEGTAGDAADAAARAEAQRRVATAVLALDEPYRSVILLRFFDGLTPGEIAARLGRRPGTVRVQLQRGLEVLRGRLDREHGAGRREWALALVPLVEFHPPGHAAALAAGGLIVKSFAKAIAAAVLLLVFAGAAATWSMRTAPVDSSPTARRAETAATSAPRSRATASVGIAPEEAQRDPDRAPSDASAPVTLRGRVLDESSRQPVPGAQVTVVPMSAETAISAAATTDADGRFELALPPGRVLARVEREGWYQPYFPAEPRDLEMWRRGATSFDRNAATVPDAGAASVELVLARTGGVEGRVVLLDGGPVPHANVVVRTVESGARPTTGTSDVDGRFRIAGVPPGRKLWVEATAPGLVTALPTPTIIEVGRVTSGIEVRLRRPPVVRGRLWSAGGRPLDAATVQVLVLADSREMQWGPSGEWLAWSGAPRTPAAPDGTFEVPVWPIRGDFVVRATSPGHEPARSATVPYAADQEVYRVDLTLAVGATLRGVVTSRATGSGIPGAVVLAGPVTNPIAKVVAPLRAVCDDDGRFAIEGVTEETFSVSASAPGYVECRIPAVVSPAEELRLVLATELTIAGTVRLRGAPVAGAIVGVQPLEDDALELFDPFVRPFSDTASTGDDGAFRVRGLVEGTYRLHVRPAAGTAFRATFSSPVAAGSDGVTVDVEPLGAGETLDRLSLPSNRDLGLSAYQMNMNGDFEGAVARWKSLLARPLTRNERAAALTEFASPLGNLGRGEEQEAALREAIDLAGRSTSRGLEALSRLAWARYWAGDAEAARARIEPVTRSPDAVQSAGARWSAAKFAARAGDVEGARIALATLKAEIERSADSRLRRLLPQVERSLTALGDR